MKFSELINLRQSTRKYSSAPISREILDQCIEATRLAPSACNAQPYTFIVVDDLELKNKVAGETCGLIDKFNKFTLNAPVMVVIVIEKANITSQAGTIIKKIEYPLVDIGIAAEHFCLQAAELGIGTCMIGWFNEKPIKNILNIPDKKNIGLLISVGYPESNNIRTKVRKEISKLSSYNGYER
jgi:nitroreductase